MSNRDQMRGAADPAAEFFRDDSQEKSAAAPLLAEAVLGPLTPEQRADRARQIRVDAAAFQRAVPLPAHTDNGDEAAYPNRIASYTKGLPHDNQGYVDTAAYTTLLAALASGSPDQFEQIPLSGVRKLVNPQSAYAYQLEGADPQALAIGPAPKFASRETGGEMEELYWMSLARDVHFESYKAASPPAVITSAITRLNGLKDFRGPKDNGAVTAGTLFRDVLVASTKGPYVSQFLLKDVPHGVQTISQRNRARVAGDDRMSAFAEWLSIQRGNLPAQPESNDPTPRYIRNGRDLAEFVRRDSPLQAALNAALIILSQGDTDSDPKFSPNVVDENNPYRPNGGYTNQEGFITFGNADVLDLIGHIVNLALRGQWFQKWLVHRRQRPEEFGGWVHAQKTGAQLPIDADLIQSPVLAQVFSRNSQLNGGTGTYLLSQAFPEGSPLHPAYCSGHSTYIGAAVTMMKAFFRDRAVQNPVQPSADGTSLVPYAGTLTIFDELDKLASNIGMGRLFGGVHWRSDHAHGVRLGELIALRVLQDMTRLYNETFSGFVVRTFGGKSFILKKDGPSLPNHVSAITRFTLINGGTAQTDPLLNDAAFTQAPNLAIRANTYPASVGSVQFILDGALIPPDNSASYDCPLNALTPGPHVLTATPFSGSGASGLGGVPLTIRFTVQS